MGLLDRLEAGIERAVQGTFARHLRSNVHPVEIASNIRRAMDDRAVAASGRAIVPNVFVIELSAGDYDRLAAEDLQGVEDDLVAAAEEHCDGQGYQPAGPIDIVFEEHDDLETGVFRIRPSKASRPRATGTTGQHDALDRRPPAGAPPAAGGGAGAAPAPAPGEADDEPEQPTRDHAPRPEQPAPPKRRSNPADRPWLDVDGERYPLMGAMTILGRDDAADIILDDPGISRRHSELRVTTDGPHFVTTVRDLGSTNGTFVNGERVTSTHLDDGDRITVGRTSITFRAGRR